MRHIFENIKFVKFIKQLTKGVDFIIKDYEKNP